MKTHLLKFVLSFGLVALVASNTPCLAQGNLTPPGPPSPTMKSLDQIEARTPISSAPFTITQPGSYYLTTNVTVSTGNAITIATNAVRLDLNGFTISSTAGSAIGAGILVTSSRNITIVNGFIQGTVTNNGSGVYSGGGFLYGIYCPGATGNVLASEISVSGCLDYGISLNTGDSILVESCTVRTVGTYGILASTIQNCSAMDCGYIAIFGDQVSNSRGQNTGSGYALYADTVAQNCYGYNSGSSYGIAAETALNCYGFSSSGDGVDAFENALNCIGFSDGGGIGLYAGSIANSCYGYSSTGQGISSFIANVCHGATGSGTALVATHNVNSF